MRQMFRYLLLGHLFIVGVESICVSVHCLRCSPTPDSCPSCQNTSCVAETNETSNCIKDFQVFVTSKPDIKEGDDVMLRCTHNLHNLNVTFAWKKDGVDLQGNQNTSTLLLRKVLPHDKGLYSCHVNSSCGSYMSSPHAVTVPNNSMYILAICGATAAILILVLSVIMKFKLKRENEKHRERMERRAQGAAS